MIFSKGIQLKHFFFLISLIVFCVLLVRAYFINITHDEAYSFYLINENYVNALATTANTHILNSLFMKLFNFLGLNHWFFLRLHSVLSFLILAYYSYRFTSFFQSKLIKTAIFCSLILNPFLLDYFSLARGYALSIAFFVACLYYVFLFQTDFSLKSLKKFYLLSVLALLSNYTVLFPLVGIHVFLLLSYKMELFRLLLNKKVFLSFLIFVGVVLFSIVNMLLIKYISNDLQYGADHSFVEESIASVLLSTIFVNTPIENLFWSNFVYFTSYILFLGMLVLCFISFYKKNKLLQIVTITFCTTFFLYFISHIFFQTPYPLNRTAIIFVPIFVISLFFGMQELNIKGVTNIVAFSLIGFHLFIFIYLFPIHHTLEWKSQAKTSDLINNISSSQIKGKRVLISCDEMNYAVLKNYYTVAYPDLYNFELNLINEMSNKKIQDSDYVIVGTNIKNLNEIDYSSFFLSDENNISLTKVFKRKNITNNK